MRPICKTSQPRGGICVKHLRLNILVAIVVATTRTVLHFVGAPPPANPAHEEYRISARHWIVGRDFRMGVSLILFTDLRRASP